MRFIRLDPTVGIAKAIANRWTGVVDWIGPAPHPLQAVTLPGLIAS